MNKTNTFPKSEKLCGEIRIGRLFAEGNAFIAYPFRIVYKLVDENQEVPVKVMISVPKKKIKKAVYRNKIKRQIREAYRLNKEVIVTSCTDHGKSLQIAITYLADTLPDYSLIDSKMKIALTKMLHILTS